jgi:PilZ domain-containing protein
MMTATSPAVGTKPTVKERRHPRARVPGDFLVAWQGAGRRDANRARDLSLGGIFIVHIDPPDPGTFMQLLFDAPDGEVRVSAKVMYVKPRRGMGVQFIGMDLPARRRLYNMLNRMMKESG